MSCTLIEMRAIIKMMIPRTAFENKLIPSHTLACVALFCIIQDEITDREKESKCIKLK